MKCIANKTWGVAAAVLFAATAAEAVPTLRISANGGANWYKLRDFDGDGNISVSGSLGSWSFSLNASGRPATGTTEFPILELSSSSLSSSRAGTLMIEFSDIFYGPIPDGNYFKTTLESDNVGTGRTTIWSHSGAANTYFDRSGLLGVIAQTGLDASTTVSSEPSSGTDQFSLTMRVAIRHGGAEESSFSAQLVDPPTAVPDAGVTVGLLGLAMAGLGVFNSRRAK